MHHGSICGSRLLNFSAVRCERLPLWGAGHAGRQLLRDLLRLQVSTCMHCDQFQRWMHLSAKRRIDRCRHLYLRPQCLGASTVAEVQVHGQQATAAATHRLGWRRCDGGGHDGAAVRPPAAAVPAGKMKPLARTVGTGHGIATGPGNCCVHVFNLDQACVWYSRVSQLNMLGGHAKRDCAALVRRMDVLVDTPSLEATSDCLSCSC